MKQTRSPIRQMPEKDKIAVLGCTILTPCGWSAEQRPAAGRFFFNLQADPPVWFLHQ